MSTENAKFDNNTYWKGKDFHTSARPHWLFQSTINFLVHPTIAANHLKAGNLRVADLGCGNGAWLLALARQFPEAEFRGFDITASNFPAPAFLPKNVTLKVHDVFQDVPSDLEESFDFIHLRAMGTPVHGKPGRLLPGIWKMLKPGGSVQWEESSFSKSIAASPDSITTKHATDQLLNLMAMGGKAQGLTSEWLDEMESIMSRHRFTDVAVDYHKTLPEHYKAWTEDYLIVYEELGSLFPSAANAAPGTPMTREQYEGLFNQVVAETQNGVVIHEQEIMVAIGRKQR